MNHMYQNMIDNDTKDVVAYSLCGVYDRFGGVLTQSRFFGLWRNVYDESIRKPALFGDLFWSPDRSFCHHRLLCLQRAGEDL